jgi:hypothetical protein
VPTLQTWLSAAARAVAEVPSVIAAAKHTDAQAKAKELIIIFVNFVFIVVVSFRLSSVVVAFFDLLVVSCHFWPFISSSLQIGPKKFQEILLPTASRPQSSQVSLAENDWQPERLPYNVTLWKRLTRARAWMSSLRTNSSAASNRW